MKRFGNTLISVVFLLSMLIFSAPAIASEDTIYTQITSEQLASIMQSYGWQVDDGSWGGVSWTIDDTWATLFLYDNGKAIQFYKYVTGVRYSLWELNEWNRDHRYSRTYLDRDGDPVIELDLDLSGGVTEARIVDWLKTCHVSLLYWYWTIVGAG